MAPSSSKPKMLSDNYSIDLKLAILKASPSVVAVVTFDVPPEMTEYSAAGFQLISLTEGQVFEGSGFIIESEKISDGIFSSTILTSAALFTRTNNIQPQNVNVKVYLVDHEEYECEFVCCDFHTNLAVLRIQTQNALQIAALKELDDVIPIKIINNPNFQLRPHSNLFKIRPGVTATALSRCPFGDVVANSGEISFKQPQHGCKELYSLTIRKYADRGGPVINCNGEVIGIMMGDKYFLPSNAFLRWWKFYKQHGRFCQPMLGLEVANLHSAGVYFLEPFLHKFPSASSGVIVTKVSKNLRHCGLQEEDVIVECNGSAVESTLKFFEKIWVNAGASMELGVLRRRGGQRLSFEVTIGEAKQNNCYSWPIPDWTSPPEPKSELEDSSGSEMEESDHEEETKKIYKANKRGRETPRTSSRRAQFR